MRSVLIKSYKYNLKYDYYAREDGTIYSGVSHKELKSHLDKDGYCKVRLISDDGRHTYSVHRLILENFNPIDGMDKLQVNHIDGNKQNNNLSNLEWVTCSKNNLHAHKIGLKNQKGECNNASKLKVKDVLEIINLLLSKQYTYKQIGDKYGVDEETIGSIKRHKTWKEYTEDINFN